MVLHITGLPSKCRHCLSCRSKSRSQELKSVIELHFGQAHRQRSTHLNHPSLSNALTVASGLFRYSLKTAGPFTQSSPVLLYDPERA